MKDPGHDVCSRRGGSIQLASGTAPCGALVWSGPGTRADVQHGRELVLALYSDNGDRGYGE